MFIKAFGFSNENIVFTARGRLTPFGPADTRGPSQARHQMHENQGICVGSSKALNYRVSSRLCEDSQCSAPRASRDTRWSRFSPLLGIAATSSWATDGTHPFFWQCWKVRRWDISPKLEQEKVEEAEPDHVSGVPMSPNRLQRHLSITGASFSSSYRVIVVPPTAFPACSRRLAEVWLLKTPWVCRGAVLMWQLWGLTWWNQYVIPLRDKILPWDRWNMKPYQNWDMIQNQLARRMYFINFHQQCDDEKVPTKAIFSPIYDQSLDKNHPHPEWRSPS